MCGGSPGNRPAAERFERFRVSDAQTSTEKPQGGFNTDPFHSFDGPVGATAAYCLCVIMYAMRSAMSWRFRNSPKGGIALGLSQTWFLHSGAMYALGSRIDS